MERRGTGSRHAPDAAAFFTPFRFRASMWVDWAHGFAPLAVYSPSDARCASACVERPAPIAKSHLLYIDLSSLIESDLWHPICSMHGSNIGLYIGNTTGVEPMREPGAPTRRDATGFPTYATTINEPTPMASLLGSYLQAGLSRVGGGS